MSQDANAKNAEIRISLHADSGYQAQIEGRISALQWGSINAIVHGAVAPYTISFPVMLRKMWSGNEVQEWLNRLPSLYAVPVVQDYSFEGQHYAAVLDRHAAYLRMNKDHFDIDAAIEVERAVKFLRSLQVPSLSSAAIDVLAERRRQVEGEGWSASHDDGHDGGDLALAGAGYALNAGCALNPLSQQPLDEAPDFWPWLDEVVENNEKCMKPAWWKPKDPRRDLVRAAALILAEIERLDRAAADGGHHG